MKTCFKCCVPKPLEDFYRHSRMRDGYLNKCKACAKRDVSVNYAAKREQYVAYEAKRQKTPERRAAQQRYAKHSKQRHPVKAKARRMLGNAVRDGKITPQPCGVCGAAKAQAHHPDYSKPLDVKWLCFKHHTEEHGKTASREWSNRPGGAAGPAPEAR